MAAHICWHAPAARQALLDRLRADAERKLAASAAAMRAGRQGRPAEVQAELDEVRRQQRLQAALCGGVKQLKVALRGLAPARAAGVFMDWRQGGGQRHALDGAGGAGGEAGAAQAVRFLE